MLLNDVRDKGLCNDVLRSQDANIKHVQANRQLAEPVLQSIEQQCNDEIKSGLGLLLMLTFVNAPQLVKQITTVHEDEEEDRDAEVEGKPIKYENVSRS